MLKFYISQNGWPKLNYIFPDLYKGWYLPALREARKILQEEKIDLIFTSSPPYTSAFIAKKLKEEFGVPWVVEWRDLWSGNYFLNLGYDKTLIKPLRKLQKLLTTDTVSYPYSIVALDNREE